MLQEMVHRRSLASDSMLQHRQLQLPNQVQVSIPAIRYTFKVLVAGQMSGMPSKQDYDRDVFYFRPTTPVMS